MKLRSITIKIISLIISCLFILTTGGLLLYPFYNDISITAKGIDIRDIAQSASLITLTSVSLDSPDVYERDFDNINALEYVSKDTLAQHQNEGKFTSRLEEMETEIEVPSVNIAGHVHDGENAHTMDLGPWHFPLSVGPGEEGNFIVIGHRFAELPPSKNTFFNLDKVKVGDKIYIKQKGDINYTYTVIKTSVVKKTDRSVLQSGKEYKISLITCTPKWTSEKRLVVVGLLDKVYRKI
ncbi:sortase [Candidatus Nomurabacteria bacterium]|nr:sortase [Candidatus Nomurabacteria bacterium]